MIFHVFGPSKWTNIDWASAGSSSVETAVAVYGGYQTAKVCVIPRSGRRSGNLVLLSHDKQDLGDSMLTRFQLPLGGRVMVTVVWNLIRTIDPSFCLFSFWENIRIFLYQTVHQLLTVASNEKSMGSGSSSRRKIFRIKLKKVVVKSNAVLVFLVFIFSKIKRNNMAEGKKEYLQYSPACP